jgi:hypothetical protein
LRDGRKNASKRVQAYEMTALARPRIQLGILTIQLNRQLSRKVANGYFPPDGAYIGNPRRRFADNA